MVCGTGTGNFPQPGDPSNDLILSAAPAFGGIDVKWTFPNLNPQAVAHTRLYRSTAGNAESRVLHSIVAGDFFYDRIDNPTPITYYYWIEVVSVNGTIGELIGPASAQARPTIEDYIEIITGQINRGVLAQSLQQELDEIPLMDLRLLQEIGDRINGESLLGTAIDVIQTGIDGVGIRMDQEVIDRQTQYSALLTVINTLAAGTENSSALIQQEATVRAEADDALSTLITALQSVVNNPLTGLVATYAAIRDESFARATADTAIASNVTTLNAAVMNPTTGLVASHSRIAQEATARATGDAATTLLVETLRSEMTNPITGLPASFAAIQNESITRATAIEAVSSQYSILYAEMNDPETGLVATHAGLVTESTARATADAAFADRLDLMQAVVNHPETGVASAYGMIVQEASLRVEADEVIAEQLDLMQAVLNDPHTGLSRAHALITEERLTRASEYGLLAQSTETLQVSLSDRIRTFFDEDPPEGTVQDPLIVGDLWVDTNLNNQLHRWNGTGWISVQDGGIQTALGRITVFYQPNPPTANRVGDIWFDTDNNDQPASWDGTDWIETEIATYQRVTSSIQENNKVMIGYCQIGGVPDPDYTSPTACTAAGGTWLTATPFAESVKQLSINTGTQTATIQQLMTAYEDELENINAQYTVKLQVNGTTGDAYIGGFGLMNSGTVVDAIFDVDNFSIGKLGSSTVFPFMVQGNETFINDAVINKLTFSKLRAADGSFIVEDGLIKADYLSVDGLIVNSARSPNYTTPGNGGWIIDENGYAEFNNIAIYDSDGELAFATDQNYLVAIDEAPEDVVQTPDPYFELATASLSFSTSLVGVRYTSPTAITTLSTSLNWGDPVLQKWAGYNYSTSSPASVYLCNNTESIPGEGIYKVTVDILSLVGAIAPVTTYTVELGVLTRSTEFPVGYSRLNLGNQSTREVITATAIVPFGTQSNVATTGGVITFTGTIPAGVLYAAPYVKIRSTSGNLEEANFVLKSLSLNRRIPQIGTSYIRNAAITTAKIGTAQIDTLTIKDGAVTSVITWEMATHHYWYSEIFTWSTVFEETFSHGDTRTIACFFIYKFVVFDTHNNNYSWVTVDGVDQSSIWIPSKISAHYNLAAYQAAAVRVNVVMVPPEGITIRWHVLAETGGVDARDMYARAFIALQGAKR